MTIGIALSGGGIKSFSQLPVLEALIKKDIHVDYYAGTSMGAAVAAFAASGIPLEVMIPSALEVEETLVKRKVFSRPSPKLLPFSKEKIHGGYVDGAIIEEIIESVFSKYNISMLSDVPYPLAIPAVDIVSGKLIVFVSHPETFKPQENWIVVSDIKLSQAVRASCSFPFIISAMPYKDHLLVDGGINMNLPLSLIEAYGANKTIAVTMHQEVEYTDYSNLTTLANRIIDLMAESKDESIVERADVHINIPLNNIWVFDFGKGQDTITEGERVMKIYNESLNCLIHKPTLWERLLGKG